MDAQVRRNRGELVERLGPKHCAIELRPYLSRLANNRAQRVVIERSAHDAHVVEARQFAQLTLRPSPRCKFLAAGCVCPSQDLFDQCIYRRTSLRLQCHDRQSPTYEHRVYEDIGQRCKCRKRPR